MRLPRDVSGDDLARALRAFGYAVTRQTGLHMRLTTAQHGEHHVTFPGINTCVPAPQCCFRGATLQGAASDFGRMADDGATAVAGPRRLPSEHAMVGILADVANHLEPGRDQPAARLFGDDG